MPLHPALVTHASRYRSWWQFSNIGSCVTELNLSLGESNLCDQHWNANVHLTLKVTIEETLEVALTSVNEGKREGTFTEFLLT